MKIAFNPSTVAALTTPPNNKDITFDLRGRNIFARGVKFCGTDTWRDIKINNVSIGSNILDLRNGSNTTLTNTNGVVTINSTWRPVVDNLTSNSTTSSLSANQGRVLAGLIDTLSTNISNQYALRNGSNATGRWRGGLACFDVRGTNYTPHDLNSGLELLFLRNNTNNLKDGGEYNGVFSFRQWASGSDWSGGKAHQLSFTDNGNIWHRTSSGDDSWGTWKKLAYSTDIPSSLKNPYSLTTFGVVYDGSSAKTVTTSTFISQVTEGTSTITDGTMFITSYASNSGFADTNAVNVPYKRKAIHLWEYIKTKTDSLYATRGHNHDDRYLKLIGGTLTGDLYINTNLYGPACGNNPRNRYDAALYFFNCNSSTTSTYNFGLYQWDNEFQFTYRTSADNKYKGNSFTIQGSDGQVTFAKTPKVGSALISLNGHTHAYLPLSGGTMTGIIRATNRGGSWISGRDHCLIRSDDKTSYSYWSAILAIATVNGYWTLGHLGDGGERIGFNYDTDADYNAGRNNNHVIWLPTGGAEGTLALTSDNVASATRLQTARNLWGQSFDGTGNVDNTLRIRQTTGNWCEGIRIQNGDNTWATIILGATSDYGTNANAWSIHRKDDNNFAISRNSSDGINGLVMTSTGMGLGTTAPTQRLDVHGNIRATGNSYATHFYESSDKTLKKNIKSILSSTNIPKIREFDWKDTEEHSYGFIAQELEEQGYGCLVSEANGKKTVNYTATLALTVAKLQNLINIQNKKISNLTKELKALKYGRKKNS